MENITKFEGGLLLLGNNKSYKIIEVGTVKYDLHDGTENA